MNLLKLNFILFFIQNDLLLTLFLTSKNMKNSKLIDLLKTFDSKELREFRDFVKSPFFNKNQELVLFYDYLKKIAPKFSEKKIDRNVVYQSLFPQKKYDDKHFKYLMSFLLKLAEKYVGLKAYQNQKLLPDFHILESFIDRNLEKHFQQNYQKAASQFNTPTKSNTNFYYHQYLLADISNQHFLSQKIRKYDTRLQSASDYLDLFFLAKKLKYSCEILDRHQSISGEYSIGMFDEISDYLESNNFDAHPTINIYYHILKILSSKNTGHFFEKLKELLFDNFDDITKDEMQTMYFLTINFCVRKVRQGEKKYVEELLLLYEKGIETQILFDNEFLSPWTYKNVVKLGLGLNKFDWTENFIHKYNSSLPEPFQKDALQFNLADLYYYKNDLDKALEHLRNVEFSDIYYTLGAKVILLKIYFELNEQEALLSLLASFNIYLKRNKLISNEIIQTYQNFVKILNILNRRKPKDFEKLESLINDTPLLVSKNWLIKQFEKVVSEV